MPTPSLLDHFSALEDPRQSWKVLYPLEEILMIVLAGVMAGADDFVEISRWARLKLPWLRRFLAFKNGVPAHDTLNDVMNALPHELSPNVSQIGSPACATTRPISWPLMAKPRAARMRPMGGRCISSAPGQRGSGWCWGRSVATQKKMKSAQYPACWSGWSCRARWLPSTRWAASTASPMPFWVYPNKGTYCDIRLCLRSYSHDCLPAGFELTCDG